jgi:uncharacterized protein (TIGR00251 family)
MLRLTTDSRGVILPVRVHAQGRRNGIIGARDGMLRVAVTVAPEKGKANRAVADVLSRALGVPKSNIELVAGETSPRKRFLVVGATVDALLQALELRAGQAPAEPS